MSPNVALVAGGSGLVGQYLIRILLEDSYYDQVIALVRRPLMMGHPRLVQRTTDFDRLSEEISDTPITHVFSTLGTTIKNAGSKEAFRKVDYDYVLTTARFGKRGGASRMIIVSSVGADASTSNFYLKTKGEMEAALATEAFEALHIFRPSVLLGSRTEDRPGERVAIALSQAFEWLLVGGLRKYRPMPAPVLANAMAVAAERGESGVRIHHYDEIKGLGC